MFSKTLLTILLGTIAGILGGALGQSGAEVMVPGLLILGLVPDFKTAAGTTLLAILAPLSILAIYVYWERNQVQVWTALILVVVYFFAAYFGAYMTEKFTNTLLEYVSGIYFIIIGIFFLWNAYTGTFGKGTEKTKHLTGIHKEGFKKVFTHLKKHIKF
jgi:uncharacterized membrane protein YfcA